MAIPALPWYGKLKEVVAPTEAVANVVLVAIILASVFLLIKGDSVQKAAWVVYVVSP